MNKSFARRIGAALVGVAAVFSGTLAPATDSQAQTVVWSNTSTTCGVLTYDTTGALIGSQNVPCAANQPWTVTLNAHQRLQYAAQFQYAYQDDGGSFAGASVDAFCTSGYGLPCTPGPAATHEYADLRSTITICDAAGCRADAAPIFLAQSNGPDAVSGATGHVFLTFPGQLVGTFTLEHQLDYAVFAAGPVPEPSTWMFFAAGLVGISLGSRRGQLLARDRR